VKNIAAGLKMLVVCGLVALGAAVLLFILPIVAILLMAGPLIAIPGLIVGVSLVIVVPAIGFAATPMAVGSGLACLAVVSKSCSLRNG